MMLREAMRKWTIILAGVLLAIGSGASWAVVFRAWEPGPRYKGMAAEYWSRAIRDGGPDRSSLSGKLEYYCGFYDKRGQPAILDGDAAAVPVLIRLLKDTDREVRLRAHMALLNIATGSHASSAEPALMQACNDHDPHVRSVASGILGIVKARVKVEKSVR